MSEWTRSGKAAAEVAESRALIWGLVIAGLLALPLGAALSIAGLAIGPMLAPSGAGQGAGALAGVSLVVGIVTIPISVPILTVVLRSLARKRSLGILQLTATFVATSSVVAIAVIIITASVPSYSDEYIEVLLLAVYIGIVFGGSDAIVFMAWIVKKYGVFRYGPMPLVPYAGLGVALILFYQLFFWHFVAGR